MNLGDRIKSLRLASQLTQDQLAQQTGLSKSFISEIENNKANISGENLLKLADVLNTSLDYLMRGVPSQDERTPQTVEIPPELSQVAEELRLTHRNTITLLKAHQSLVARRSSKVKTSMTREDWREFYERLRDYLD